ncbi:MAG: preprotein translocase subunit SecY [Clostridiales bacterium]|nr:preprotein translocase subunit SecY [Candidatus Coliplasma equi]
MFRVFGNAWKIPDLKKKILFTLLVIVLYRLGSAIPVPYVNGTELANLMELQGQTLFGYFNMLSGYAFSQGTLFALGVSPYITASIVIQLLTIAIPALERMSKDGVEGQAKISKITRYTTIGLAIITGYGYYLTIKNTYSGLIPSGWFPAVVIVGCLTAGASLVMWTGEEIDDKGIGNGIYMILFANIVSRGANLIATMIELIKNDARQILWVVIAILMLLIIIALTVFFNNSERRLNVQYAKRQVGRKMYGGMNTTLPIKVLMSGVMPIIFANAVVMMPATLAMIFPSWKDGVNKWFSTSSEYPFYVLATFVLIIAFAYFYLSISFNSVEVANNLKKNGGTILGYRPGKPTADYITKVVNRVTLIGSIFLSFMAIFPILLAWTNQPALNYLVFGGTSMIIIVSVALETTHELESEITMRHYKGFLD